jgi:hypothetical protein
LQRAHPALLPQSAAAMFGPSKGSAWGAAAEPLLDAALASDSDGDTPAVPPPHPLPQSFAPPHAALPPTAALAAEPVDLREQGARALCGNVAPRPWP